MLRLRVELTDRPGALARLTGAVAAAGGNIAQLVVMDRSGNTATDDLWVSTGAADAESLCAAVAALPDTRLLGVRPGAATVDFDAQLDFLAYLFAAPQRGVESLVDMLPTVVDADWAAIRPCHGETGYDSELGDGEPPRRATDDAVAELPLGDRGHVVVGRNRSLPWHPAELRRTASVLELGTLFIRTCASSTSYPLTPLTAWLSTGVDQISA